MFSQCFDNPMTSSKPNTHPTPPTPCRDPTLRTSCSEPTSSNAQAKQPNLYVDHTVQASSPAGMFSQCFDNAPLFFTTDPLQSHTLRTSYSEPTSSNAQAKQPNLYVDHTVQASSPARMFSQCFDSPMKHNKPSTHPTAPTPCRDHTLRTSNNEPTSSNAQAKQPNMYVD